VVSHATSVRTTFASEANGCTFSLMSAGFFPQWWKTASRKKSRLRVYRVVDVPLHEVSGICLRRSRTGRMPLIAVGDRASKIAWFSLPRSDKGRIDWHTSDSSKLSGSMLPEGDPQIEAVCADGLGRIPPLQETPRASNS